MSNILIFPDMIAKYVRFFPEKGFQMCYPEKGLYFMWETSKILVILPALCKRARSI
jgi:hypothetical protein